MQATLHDSSEFSSELRSSIRRRRRQQSEAMYRVTAADDTANGSDCLLVGALHWSSRKLRKLRKLYVRLQDHWTTCLLHCVAQIKANQTDSHKQCESSLVGSWSQGDSPWRHPVPYVGQRKQLVDSDSNDVSGSGSGGILAMTSRKLSVRRVARRPGSTNDVVESGYAKREACITASAKDQ